MKTFLTIAGSDPSGGAGIQADIKTAAAFGLYAMGAVTALTVQNTLGVRKVAPIDAGIVYDQAAAVFDDIFPDCVKIGMCCDEYIVSAIAELLERYRPKNVVVDTILLSTSGSSLLSENGAELMKKRLFPLADIITPNVPEAERLTGIHIRSEEDMERAAEFLFEQYGCGVFLKGGHLNGCDIFYDGKFSRYSHKLIASRNTHGTGCTLSSAAACLMAQGKTAAEAALGAAEYVVGAINSGMDLGAGNGPLDHFYSIRAGTARH